MDHLLYTSEEILERVDEYTLYCSYLEMEPLIGAKYLSPVRSAMDKDPDSSPSFGLFEKKKAKGPHEFMWMDQGLGLHGDIFDLVRVLCRFETRFQAMQQVLIDAGIVEGKKSRPVIDLADKKYQGCSKITIASKPRMTPEERHYWAKINVHEPLLTEYFTTAIKMYWLYEDQEAPRFPRGMGFAYRMWDRYQLYFPQAHKKKKFRNDLTDACVPGFLQLRYNSPLLVITKSFKDVICLRSFGYEAVAPRGENVVLPPSSIDYFKKRYERILVLFDPDMKHKGSEYEFPKIYVPQDHPGDKDPTDFCNNHGIPDTADMLRQITEI